MNRTFTGFVLIGALLSFVPQALAEDRNGNQGGLQIHVRIHNYAGVGSEILTPAEAQAAEILAKAGVQIIWTNSDYRADLGAATGCTQVLAPTNLGVRIIPYFRVTPGITKRTMGLAVGDLATVSVGRVKEEAAEFGVQPWEVLGPAIAHEIGHLLGQKRHSLTGIMRAGWRREDYERAPRGAFKFTAQQAEQIGVEVKRRVEAQGAAEVATAAATK